MRHSNFAVRLCKRGVGGGKKTDRVPVFDASNNLKLFKRELGIDNFYFQGIPAVRLSKRLGLDACLIPEAGYTGLISRHWKWPDREHFIDELNVEYAVNESSWPLGIPKKPSLKGRMEMSEALCYYL